MTKTLTTPTPAHVDAAKAVCDYPDCDHEFCAPVDVAPLTDYALEITASHDALDGVYWEGYLYRTGEKVLVVGNRGDGGPNIYCGDRTITTDWHAAHREFLAAAKAAFPTVTFEQDDCAVAFLDLVAEMGSPAA